jgi:hypothetical protein
LLDDKVIITSDLNGIPCTEKFLNSYKERSKKKGKAKPAIKNTVPTAVPVAETKVSKITNTTTTPVIAATVAPNITTQPIAKQVYGRTKNFSTKPHNSSATDYTDSMLKNLGMLGDFKITGFSMKKSQGKNYRGGLLNVCSNQDGQTKFILAFVENNDTTARLSASISISDQLSAEYSSVMSVHNDFLCSFSDYQKLLDFVFASIVSLQLETVMVPLRLMSKTTVCNEECSDYLESLGFYQSFSDGKYWDIAEIPQRTDPNVLKFTGMSEPVQESFARG